MGTRITAGVGTWIGIIGACAGVLIPMLGQLSDAAEPLGVSPDVWVVAGSILAGLVIIGRMAQAVANTVSPEPVFADQTVDTMPTDPSDVSAT